MIQNIVNFYPKSKNIISSLLHVMKAEKRLDRFKYIFPRHLIGPLFHHYIMNLSGKAFNRENELRVNFGTNFEKFHLLRHKSLTSAHVIFLHGAEVNIPIELGATWAQKWSKAAQLLHKKDGATVNILLLLVCLPFTIFESES